MDRSEGNTNSTDIKAKAKPKRKIAAWNVLLKLGNACSKCLAFSPVKMLCRARKAYTETLLSCKGGQESAVQVPVSVKCNKSGCRREEENLRRLIKMTEIKLQLQLNVENSATEAESEAESDAVTTMIMSARPPSLGALRSSSAGAGYGMKHMNTSIAPIDEESPCYFPGSFKKRWATPLPRSGSCGTTPS